MTLVFQNDILPQVEEFVRQLRLAEDQYDPVEKLLALERELSNLEKEYHISSAEFFQRYQTGEMGDEIVFVRWAGRYEQYRHLKNMISSSLQMVLANKSGV